MTIDTKYYIEKGIIRAIDVSARMEYGVITRRCVAYDVKIDNCVFVIYEHGIFPTKEDLLKSL